MKQVLVVLMLGLLAGCGSGGGGSPSVDLGPTPVQAQTPQYVTVTNDPLRVDLANGTIPVTVTVDPALLTQSKKVIGLDSVCSPVGGVVVTAYTVPQGKTFILTDVVGSPGVLSGTISRQVGSANSTVLDLTSSSLQDLHLVSGFDFGPGSQVLWLSLGTRSLCVSLSGYLIPA